MRTGLCREGKKGPQDGKDEVRYGHEICSNIKKGVLCLLGGP